MYGDPLPTDFPYHLLEVFGKGIPLIGIHDHKHGRGVPDAGALCRVVDYLCLFPPFEGLDWGEGPFDHALLQGLVGAALGHGHRGAAQGLHHLGAQPGGADLHALELCQILHGLLGGVQQSGPVGVQVEHVHVIEFGRLKARIVLVDHARGRHAAGVAQRQVAGLHDRETPARVGEARHADIRDAADHAVVALVGRGERAAGKDVDLHRTIGALLDLPRPGLTRLALGVLRREEDAVGKLDGGLFRLCRLRDGRLGRRLLIGTTAAGRPQAGHQKTHTHHVKNSLHVHSSFSQTVSARVSGPFGSGVRAGKCTVVRARPEPR